MLVSSVLPSVFSLRFVVQVAPHFLAALRASRPRFVSACLSVLRLRQAETTEAADRFDELGDVEGSASPPAAPVGGESARDDFSGEVGCGDAPEEGVAEIRGPGIDADRPRDETESVVVVVSGEAGSEDEATEIMLADDGRIVSSLAAVSETDRMLSASGLPPNQVFLGCSRFEGAVSTRPMLWPLGRASESGESTDEVVP